jgi:hypothetical protein
MFFGFEIGVFVGGGIRGEVVGGRDAGSRDDSARGRGGGSRGWESPVRGLCDALASIMMDWGGRRRGFGI